MSQDNPEVRLEIRINACPKMVFTLLTDPVHMRTWLAESLRPTPDRAEYFVSPARWVFPSRAPISK
jgi:uncharacterized protein YndB with AHSA1/START domain